MILPFMFIPPGAAPKNLIIKDKKDLRKKLEEGIKDTESGRVCSLDEAFLEIDSILAE